tara:strand:+ start:830 stop:2104 length:1275 start_codon:yes stop_codon:yes gene_type:complete
MYSTYRLISIFFFPIFILLIFFRVLIKKEDPKRFTEKILKTNIKNFKKNKETLIWFHGASIGEILSIKQLIKNYEKKRNIKILITSVTVSSAKIIEKEFKNKKKIKHFYFPLDVPHLVKNFLSTFRPDIAIFIDSEIWPNFIYEIKKNKIPLALINARITDKTLNSWQIIKNFSRKIFSSFDLCISSSLNSKKNLKILNAKNIKYFGNLKFVKNEDKKIQLSKKIINYFNKYKVWCAISTHKTEEVFCMNVHKNLKKKYKKLITIIIPRHINRSMDIYSKTKKLNLKSQIIDSEKQIIDNKSEILIINSYGILRKYLDYCKSVFIGKSKVKNLHSVGGQNPIEAAYLGCSIYHGPYVYNFKEVYEHLKKYRMANEINTVDDLTSFLINDFKSKKKIDKKRIVKLEKYGKKILTNTLNRLNNLFL